MVIFKEDQYDNDDCCFDDDDNIEDYSCCLTPEIIESEEHRVCISCGTVICDNVLKYQYTETIIHEELGGGVDVIPKGFYVEYYDNNTLKRNYMHKRYNTSLTYTKKQRQIWKYMSIILQIETFLNISEHTVSLIREIVTLFIESKVTICSSNRLGFIASCIYYCCQTNSENCSLDMVCKILNIEKRDFCKGKRFLNEFINKNKTNIFLNNFLFPKDESYIKLSEICSILELHHDILMQCLQFKNKYYKDHFSNNTKERTFYACVLVYIVKRKHKIKKPIIKIILKTCKTSSSTLYKHMKILYTFI